MKNKKPTVTIGIPAYNEEANIRYLLKSLLKQKQDNFILEKIIVVSDGSKDNTEEIVKKFKDKRIKLIKNRSRLGQCKSQNLIVSMIKSDYLLLLEADTLPSNNQYASGLVRFARKNSASVVQGFPTPLRPKSFIGKVLVKQTKLYSNYYSGMENDSHMHVAGHGGKLIANKVLSRLAWPENVSEDLYLLLFCKKNNIKYMLNNDSKCLFRYPENLKDYAEKRKKILSGRRSMERHFSREDINNCKLVSTKDLLFMSLRFSVTSPIKFLAYLVIKIRLKFILRNGFKLHTYPYAKSTKYLV